MKNINSLISFLNEQESEDKSKIIINMIFQKVARE